MGRIKWPGPFWNHNVAEAAILWEKSQDDELFLKDGVADGTRTRNNQNHNLGIYH